MLYNDDTGFGVILEYAGIQCPDDKPYIESCFGHYKTQEVYRSSYPTLAELRSAGSSTASGTRPAQP